MDPVLEQATKDQVNVYVQGDKLFTAYDVTKALRNEQGLTVNHWEVRKVVHYMFNDGDMPSHMMRESRSVGGGRTAFVYMPTWRASDTYDPDDLGGTADPTTGSPTTTAPTTPTTPTTTPTQPPLPSTPSSTPDGRHGTDKRGRLCIPNEMTRKLNWKKGNIISVLKDNGRLAIQQAGGNATPPVSATVVATYMLDKSDNVRLSKTVIGEIGQSGHFDINCDESTETISVTI